MHTSWCTLCSEYCWVLPTCDLLSHFRSAWELNSETERWDVSILLATPLCALANLWKLGQVCFGFEDSVEIWACGCFYVRLKL